MLKVPYRKLRPNSKGGLNNKHNKCSYQHKLQYVGKRIVQGIPVLSIFALVGIFVYSTIVQDTNTTSALTIPDPTAPASASLTISGSSTDAQISAGRGSTAYRQHLITISATNISDYSITISGPANLQNAHNDLITPTNGATTGANLADNTWGYAWDNPNADQSNLTYRALSPTGSNLTTSDKPAITNNSINFSRQLTFATKFGADITEGRYYSSDINLSLTVSPKMITLGVTSSGTDVGISTMQEITPSICNNLKTGDRVLLQDDRDQSIYSIAKLADGNCWMVDNLRIAGQTVTLASGNTGQPTDLTYAIPSAGTWTTTDGVTTGVYYDNSSTGAYYTWDVVTGGHSSVTTTYGTTAPVSICPIGWTLPTGESTGQFATLYNKYHANQVTASQRILLGATSETLGGAYFPAAGLVIEGKLASLGIEGSYWSRTVDSDTNIFYLYFSQGTLSPEFTYRNRNYGFSVRCVAPSTTTTLNNITTMQELTPTICNNTTVGVEKTLRDTRGDNYSYTVKKLSDGNCWMTSNLRLPGGTSINRTNSDLDPSIYTSDGQTYQLPPSTSDFSSDNATQQMHNSEDNTYGAYYSWCTATANSCQLHSTALAANTNATSSICPKGWKLPRSGKSIAGLTKNDFATLAGRTSTNSFNIASSLTTSGSYQGITIGNAFWPFAGLVYGSNLADTNVNGYYWSRTSAGTNTAYYLDLVNNGGVDPSCVDNRHRGFSVRCVMYSD